MPSGLVVIGSVGREMLPSLVMHVSVHPTWPYTLQQRRAHSNENSQSYRRPATVLTREIFRHAVDRATSANSQGGTSQSGPFAHLSERQRAHIECLLVQRRG